MGYAGRLSAQVQGKLERKAEAVVFLFFYFLSEFHEQGLETSKVSGVGNMVSYMTWVEHRVP